VTGRLETRRGGDSEKGNSGKGEDYIVGLLLPQNVLQRGNGLNQDFKKRRQGDRRTRCIGSGYERGCQARGADRTSTVQKERGGSFGICCAALGC